MIMTLFDKFCPTDQNTNVLQITSVFLAQMYSTYKTWCIAIVRKQWGIKFHRCGRSSRLLKKIFIAHISRSAYLLYPQNQNSTWNEIGSGLDQGRFHVKGNPKTRHYSGTLKFIIIMIYWNTKFFAVSHPKNTMRLKLMWLTWLRLLTALWHVASSTTNLISVSSFHGPWITWRKLMYSLNFNFYTFEIKKILK